MAFKVPEVSFFVFPAADQQRCPLEHIGTKGVDFSHEERELLSAFWRKYSLHNANTVSLSLLLRSCLLQLLRWVTWRRGNLTGEQVMFLPHSCCPKRVLLSGYLFLPFLSSPTHGENPLTFTGHELLSGIPPWKFWLACLLESRVASGLWDLALPQGFVGNHFPLFFLDRMNIWRMISSSKLKRGTNLT